MSLQELVTCGGWGWRAGPALIQPERGHVPTLRFFVIGEGIPSSIFTQISCDLIPAPNTDCCTHSVPWASFPTPLIPGRSCRRQSRLSLCDLNTVTSTPTVGLPAPPCFSEAPVPLGLRPGQRQGVRWQGAGPHPRRHGGGTRVGRPRGCLPVGVDLCLRGLLTPPSCTLSFRDPRP